MHECKTAFLSKRQQIVNPLRSWKKRTKRIRNPRKRTSIRVKKFWLTFGQGEFEELRSLTILNTKFRKGTYYFKSNDQFVSIENLLLSKNDTTKVGFFGQVFPVTIDTVTGVYKIDKSTHPKRFNMVLLEEFKSTFIEQDKTTSEHYLRRPPYYGYDYEKVGGKEWVAIIP